MGRFFRERFLLLHIRLKHFGKVPICNGKRERGIFIGDFCLPLCTRCTFMIISFLLFYILTLTLEKAQSDTMPLTCSGRSSSPEAAQTVAPPMETP